MLCVRGEREREIPASLVPEPHIAYSVAWISAIFTLCKRKYWGLDRKRHLRVYFDKCKV